LIAPMNHLPKFDVSPFRLSGVVYGALLNHRPQLQALGEAVNEPPYKAPPKGPVLEVKPRNTLGADGDAVIVPRGCATLQMGASLGIVIGRSACCVAVASALEYVAGYTIVNSISVPVAAHYRPGIRFRACDGFCPIGPRVLARDRLLQHPDTLGVQVLIDGVEVSRGSTGERLRNVAQLVCDVTEFMTLQAGDLLLLGAPADSPMARAGQLVTVCIDHIGRLSNRLVAEAPAAYEERGA
jgi:5-oxopent-3-ene-1,2,5-tricarboxylate decarboxylase/2-hydroxyhepta-2,4-diene-1,7-dioate isomerase